MRKCRKHLRWLRMSSELRTLWSKRGCSSWPEKTELLRFIDQILGRCFILFCKSSRQGYKILNKTDANLYSYTQIRIHHFRYLRYTCLVFYIQDFSTVTINKSHKNWAINIWCFANIQLHQFGQDQHCN